MKNYEVKFSCFKKEKVVEMGKNKSVLQM